MTAKQTTPVHLSPARRKEIAAQLSINEQYLWQCLTGRRNMSATEARRVETGTNGEITRQMVCQGTWRDVWPELDVSEAAHA